jgi:hypothetical protein
MQPHRAQPFGRPSGPFARAAGLHSEGFETVWSRFGHTRRVPGEPLAGHDKLAVWQQLQRERYRLTCVDDSVAALAAAASSNAPRHMRSEVDVTIFGRDHDRSDGLSDNALLSRLPHDTRAARLPRSPSAVGRPHGGPPAHTRRLTAVSSRPFSSGHPAHILWAQRATPEFSEELSRIHRKAFDVHSNLLQARKRAAWT